MSRTRESSDSPGAWLLAAAFLALAALLIADPWPFADPVEAREPAPAWARDPAPVRRPLLRPEIKQAGYTYRCSECHDLFPSPPETDRPLTQHTHVVLEHGLNTRCFNCHNRLSRDAFADERGGEISYAEPQLLCARCHGPVYRDWLNRSHGRTNGTWDERFGPMGRLKCIQCHDPHRPPFPPMLPAPGPRTLRMGEPAKAGSHGGAENPLRVFRQAPRAAAPEERP